MRVFFHRGGRPGWAYLGSGVVEHLLPGWIQGVPVSPQALFRHVHHLSGRAVHGHGPLVPQSGFLGFLLCLEQKNKIPKKSAVIFASVSKRKKKSAFQRTKMDIVWGKRREFDERDHKGWKKKEKKTEEEAYDTIY